jgi:alpha-L-fucosidase
MAGQRLGAAPGRYPYNNNYLPLIEKKETIIVKSALRLRRAACIGVLAPVLAASLALPTFAQAPEPQPATATPAPSSSRLQWWHEARFGLFIHWGLYAIPGRGEWVQWNEQIPVNEYAKLADQFKPARSAPEAWAEMAKSAGMQYMVLTARHHDGFALFDDGDNPFTSVNTGARRDLVADYVKAVRKAGLKVGLYYSPLDWRNPGFFFPDLYRHHAEALRADYHRQVEKLMTHYGKIDVLWFDGGENGWLNFGADWQPYGGYKKRPWGSPSSIRFNYEQDKLYAKIRRLQPDVVINNRADMPHDFLPRETEGALGNFDNQRPWELCASMSASWGYEPNQTPKPLAHYIHLLVKVVGRDGNLLLNVGPDANGQVDAAQVARLGEIGAWLGKYGESIYKTRGGPFLPSDTVLSTHRGNTVFVHVLKWPDGKLTLPALPAKVVRASALTGGQVSFTQSAQGIDVAMAPGDRAAIDTIVALELDRAAGSIAPVAWGR